MRPRDLLVAFQTIIFFESIVSKYFDTELPEA
jgi:hypothetical protein